MSQVDAKEIIRKYQKGECTPEEQAIVEHYIIYVAVKPEQDVDMQPDLDDLRARLIRTTNKKSWKITWPARVAILAACTTVLLCVGNLIFAPPDKHIDRYKNEVDPGSDKAILTLENGTKINLSDAKSGALLKQSGIEIIKAEDGTLVYKVGGSTSNTAEYNTITTPRGGQYKIILPDGTRVWLNAASSLTYRTSLNNGSNQRKVNLSGEAYFEVNKLKSIIGKQRITNMPFIVKTAKQEVTVLGTHFNISSYEDEPETKTTLLEGIIRVSTPHSKKGGTILKPGDQAVINGAEIKVKQIDTSLAVAWKNEEFMFRNESLESIMRKVARWYDVQVIYQNDEIGKERFGGTISRYDKISKVLRALEGTGEVKFQVEGRKITVK